MKQILITTLLLFIAASTVKAQINTSDDTPLRVIAIFAHPDDADSKMGATAAMMAEMGHEVKFLSLTNGDAGHQEKGGGALARIRRAEAEEAGERLGIEEYEVFDNHDAELLPDLHIRMDVIRAIREWNADVVLGLRPNDYHPDHRNAGKLVIDASYMVIVPNVAPDTPPLPNNPVFFYMQDRFSKPNPFSHDVVVGIDSHIETKLAGLDAHTSQMYEWLPWTNQSLDEVPEDPDERVEWLRQRWIGREMSDEQRAGLEKWYGSERASEFKYAESFEIAEYGRYPSEEELKMIFPMLGN
ncbi:PIG-L deacetylase family protein [Rhodohalobacter barkolensis]|uniref:GlcNAc-PI de-N-acetylase n=1 Tax=Rhodohalobacter barkolensis TaxID=2053187 RepID=A0A2N0VME5_9BACT|nr:GlcNAc-PI de-N-acetylase [Rhodohalobacter barkolensis]